MTAVDDHPVERTDIPDPPKLLRLGSMIKNLLDEVHAMPLDERGRIRLVGIHAQAVAELRVAQAQLVGWLEGLFQGVQFASALHQSAVGRSR